MSHRCNKGDATTSFYPLGVPAPSGIQQRPPNFSPALISFPLFRPQTCRARDDPRLVHATVPPSHRNNRGVFGVGTLPLPPRAIPGLYDRYAQKANNALGLYLTRGGLSKPKQLETETLVDCVSWLKDGG
jgi:hypothetical protein